MLLGNDINISLGFTTFAFEFSKTTFLKSNIFPPQKNKYGDKVKVYTIGDFSKEICGGPHVERTGSLGHFKIVKEEAVSAGVRRIKAILE